MLSGGKADLELVEFNLALHATRCILLHLFARLTPTLLPAMLAKFRDIIDDFRESRYMSKLLSLTLNEFRDLLKRGRFIADLKIERRNNIIRIEVVGCTIARDIHRCFKIREVVCPIIQTAYLILTRNFKEVKFAGIPYITEHGAVAEFEVSE